MCTCTDVGINACLHVHHFDEEACKGLQRTGNLSWSYMLAYIIMWQCSTPILQLNTPKCEPRAPFAPCCVPLSPTTRS